MAAAAEFLEMLDFSEKLDVLLYDHFVSERTCMAIFDFADLYNRSALKQKTGKIIMKNLMSFLENDSFKALSAYLFTELFQTVQAIEIPVEVRLRAAVVWLTGKGTYEDACAAKTFIDCPWNELSCEQFREACSCQEFFVDEAMRTEIVQEMTRRLNIQQCGASCGLPCCELLVGRI